MATVADTFNRTNTSQGTLGSTDTGNLPWQNPTLWEINTNAAKNTDSSGVWRNAWQWCRGHLLGGGFNQLLDCLCSR